MRKFAKIRPVFTSRVKKTMDENYRVKTIEMERAMDEAMPGQFLMVWVPGIGEKPMGIANSYPLTISVANVGPVSGALHKLKAGDSVSYRGPFGRPFSMPVGAKRILVVGGGYGVVPMYFMAKRAREAGAIVIAVVGGKTEKDIVYEKHLFAVCQEVFVTTDDGTRGRKGNVMVEVEDLVRGRDFDCVYACGPERMMHAVAMFCTLNGVPCQVSLERYMKCGTGVCGSCAIDGKLVCVDGPVFTASQVLKLEEFGRVHRDASGKKC